MTSARRHVVVVGGGLAGLSAAVACLDAGARVTLLEARPRLGGATWSFDRKGLQFDNGQHVHLACCTEYRSFLERLGTAHLAPLRGRLSLPVLRRTGAGSTETAWIRRSPLPLPAPLHLGSSLLGYKHLGLLERLRLFPAALRLRGIDLSDAALDSETFGSFLARHGQGRRAVEVLWDLITLPTTNMHAADVSLRLAAKVFQTGLLTEARAADIGWAEVPLAKLHVEPAADLIEQLGGTVRKSAGVQAIRVDPLDSGPAVTGAVLNDGSLIEADAVVLAVPHEAAAGLLPHGAHPDPGSLLGLGVEPIVNVHLVFDRRVMHHQVAAAVESPVQFVFDRSAAAGAKDGRQVLAVSISGAEDEIGERPESLIERMSTEVERLFPAASGARLLDAVVTREHDATFRGVPGTQVLRTGPATGISNLALAGSWTDTGWPATMEGAVRSGRSAARHLLASTAERTRQAPAPSPLTDEKQPEERQEAIA